LNKLATVGGEMNRGGKRMDEKKDEKIKECKNFCVLQVFRR